MGAAFLSAVLLSFAVRSYDSPLKGTPLGPLLMGLCRSLNILMVGCTMLATSPIEVFPPPSAGACCRNRLVHFRRDRLRPPRRSSKVHRLGLVFGIVLEVAGHGRHRLLAVVGCR